MKKYLATLAVILLGFVVISVSAQNQAPPPTQQDQGYGPYDNDPGPQYGPQGGQYAPPYNRQTAPPPYQNNQQPPNQQTDQQVDQDNGQPDAQQPGVARISLIDGDVSLQHGDSGDWEATTVNTPVTTDDRVSTADRARAEIELDYADVLRMSGSATAKVASISRQGIQLQIGQGLVTYNVLKGSEAGAEIDTPNATILPQGEGEYRILVNSDAETEVTVWRGSAQVTTPQGTTDVKQGQTITIAGTDNPQYRTTNATGKDDWDGWNEGRNRTLSATSTLDKSSPYYTGSGDLDQNGVWSEIPDYGQVWTPSNAGPDWTPYSDGRWTYEPYYGWTWVSYEPWGWAPYHYGRWFVHGGNWVWWPGPVYGGGYYPVWAPAYVSFFGWGGGGFGLGVGFGFGFGWGFGHVGWLPCGPGDWYHPWWGRYGGRFNTVNITNVNNFHEGFRPIGPHGGGFSNISEASRNARVRSGMNSMDSNRFGRDAVHGHGAGMSEAGFRQASMVSGKMPINPSRESFSPSGRTANPSSVRNATPNSQRFFTGGSHANNGANSRSSFGSANNSARVNSAAPENRGGTFERPSQNINSGRTSNSGSAQSSRPGWRSFSGPQSGADNRSANSVSGNNRPEVNNSSRGSFASPDQRPSSQGEFQRPSANAGAQTENRNSWQHFTPPSSASRGASSNSYSRPPLNMRQPIVTQRGAESRSYNSNTSRGSSEPSRTYSAPRTYSQPSPTYSAPRGNYSAPAPRPSYSAPRSSGGGYSAPRSSGGGGGGSRGGNGGGSHSSGGHSGHR